MNNQTLIASQLFDPAFAGQTALFKNIHYYSKNANAEYIDCNEPVAHALNLSSIDDIKHLNDHSFGWSKERIHFLREHDLAVMQTNTVVCKLEEPFNATDGHLMQLISYKIPLYDNGKPTGIIGISIDIRSSNFLNEDNIKNLQSLLSLQKYSDGRYDELSLREKQCVQYFLDGKTAKETAAILGLSHRTIEEYFTSIKEKLGCKNKRDLIAIFR